MTKLTRISTLVIDPLSNLEVVLLQDSDRQPTKLSIEVRGNLDDITNIVLVQEMISKAILTLKSFPTPEVKNEP